MRCTSRLIPNESDEPQLDTPVLPIDYFFCREGRDTKHQPDPYRCACLDCRRFAFVSMFKKGPGSRATRVRFFYGITLCRPQQASLAGPCQLAFTFLTGFAVPVHLFPVFARSFSRLSSKLLCFSVADTAAKMLVFTIGVLRPGAHLHFVKVLQTLVFFARHTLQGLTSL
jgi:hypothetical protein